MNSVLVFAPGDRIRIGVLSCPGTWHDSYITDNCVYNKVEDVSNACHRDAKIVVDLAVALRNKEHILIKSSQTDPEQADGILLNRYTSLLRQMSKWGMRMLQGQFPRMKDPLCFEELGDRRIIIHLFVNLYNYQCSKVLGHNQILTVFMKRLAAMLESIQLPYAKTMLEAGYFSSGTSLSANANELFH